MLPERHELVRAGRLPTPVLGGVGGAEAKVTSLADMRRGEILEAVVAERGSGVGGGGGGGGGEKWGHVCFAW